MEQTIPLGYGSLDDGRVHTYALIDQLREQAPITLVCCAFDVPTSCFYDYLARKRTINRERIQQRSELRRLFKESRDSAGSRALMSMMRELGYQIGRFKVRNLMKEAGLASKQPGAHRYRLHGLNDRIFPICWPANLMFRNPIKCGVAISPTSGSVVVGITWPQCSTSIPGGSLAGRCLTNLIQNWQSKRWSGLSAAGLPLWCAVSL